MRYESKYLTNDLKQYIQDNWSMYITRKVHEIYNNDNFDLIKYDDSVYIEPTTELSTIPNFVYDYVKRFCKDNGYKFYSKEV